ncbi:hypothetical protein BY996DRAFT_6742899, partial [Phakopsora pachyrhizi]
MNLSYLAKYSHNYVTSYIYVYVYVFGNRYKSHLKLLQGGVFFFLSLSFEKLFLPISLYLRETQVGFFFSFLLDPF